MNKHYLTSLSNNGAEQKTKLAKLPEIWLSAQLCPSTSVTTAVQLRRSSCNASYFSWRCRRSFYRSDISGFRRIGGAFFFFKKRKHAANSCVVIVHFWSWRTCSWAVTVPDMHQSLLCVRWLSSTWKSNSHYWQKKLHSQSRTFCKRKRRLVLSYEGGRKTCELILKRVEKNRPSPENI